MYRALRVGASAANATAARPLASTTARFFGSASASSSGASSIAARRSVKRIAAKKVLLAGALVLAAGALLSSHAEQQVAHAQKAEVKADATDARSEQPHAPNDKKTLQLNPSKETDQKATAPTEVKNEAPQKSASAKEAQPASNNDLHKKDAKQEDKDKHSTSEKKSATADKSTGHAAKSTSNAKATSTATSSSAAAGVDDDDDEAEYQAWKKKMDEGFSAPAVDDAHANRRHVRNIVASQVPEAIEQRTSDVLLQVYAPWCGACKMMQPIVDATAEVLHTLEEDATNRTLSSSGIVPSSSGNSSTGQHASPCHVQVVAMDGEANRYPGLLTEEEDRALPVIKFFPKCGSKSAPAEQRSRPECQPSVYEGRPNVQAMVEFVHDAMSRQAKAEPFDLSQAHAIGQALEPSTRAAVEVALTQRFEADAEEMPALKVHAIAPCGHLLEQLMRRFMLSGYQSYVPSLTTDEAEGQALFTAYRECTDREATKLEDFWTQVKKQADDALENLDNKRRAKEEQQRSITTPTETPESTANKPALTLEPPGMSAQHGPIKPYESHESGDALPAGEPKGEKKEESTNKSTEKKDVDPSSSKPAESDTDAANSNQAQHKSVKAASDSTKKKEAADNEERKQKTAIAKSKE